MTIFNEESTFVIIPKKDLDKFTSKVEYRDPTTIHIYTKQDSGKDKYVRLIYLTDYTLHEIIKHDGVVREYSIHLNKAITHKGSILLERILPIVQRWDSSYVTDEGSNTREKLFDQSRMIEQQLESGLNELKEEVDYIKLNITSSKLPDPSNQVYGGFIIANGKQAYEFFPYRFDHVSKTDDGGVLTLDYQNNKFKYVQPASGSHNPPIPQPTRDIRNLISDNGVYKLSASQDSLTSSDKDVVLVWNGVAFKKTDASSLSNPLIPRPTKQDQILESDKSNNIVWSDKPDALPQSTAQGQQLESDKNLKPVWVGKPAKKDSLNTEMSTGIISGFDISRIDDTHILVHKGVYQLVDDTVGDNPDVVIKNYSGTPNFQITLTGKSSFLYFNGANKTLKLESTFADNPRGSSILLAEIEHTHDNKITRINPLYTVINSTAYQVKDMMKTFIGNIAKFIEISLVSKNSNSFAYTDGKFHGYGVNANKSKANPNKVDLPAKSPASFRWRTSNDVDGAPLTVVDVRSLKIESPTGTIIPISPHHCTQCLMWIGASGELILQYGFEDVKQFEELLQVADFIKEAPKSNLTLRNYALVAVVQIRHNKDIKDSNIIQLTGINLGGSSDTVIGLPPVGSTDIGKSLIVGASTTWEVTKNKVISLPTPSTGDSGKSVVVDSGGKWIINPVKAETLPKATVADKGKFTTVDAKGDWALSSFEIPKPEANNKNLFLKSTGTGLQYNTPRDGLARTWLTSGVIKGFHPVEILSSGTSIKIPAGDVIFMDDKEGEPEHQTYRSIPVNPQYDLMQISKNDATYIYINKAGNILETYTSPDYVRGDKVALFRLDHSDRKKIEGVTYLFENQNALPNQIKELWSVVGNTCVGLDLKSKGNASLEHSGCIFKGYNSGVGVDELRPHKKTLPSLSPLPFEFRDVSGKDGATITAFPAIPKVEKVKGTQTDLSAGHVAFYPVWIEPSNRLIVQVATEEYPVANTPNVTDVALVMKPNEDARLIGSFIGFVKWERGKNFTNGCEFIPFSLLGGVASGASSSLPAHTTKDENRVLQVSKSGGAKWGVKIISPTSGSKDTNATFDNQGNIVASPSGGATIPNAPHGDFYVVIRDGKLEALTNHSDGLNMGFFSNFGLSKMDTNPFPQGRSAMGIQCLNMTKNNAGAGIQQHLRTSDVWNGMETMGDGLPNSVLDVIAAGRTYKDCYTRMMKYDTTQKYIDWIRPGKGKIRTNETSLNYNVLQNVGYNTLYLGSISTGLPFTTPTRVTNTNTELTNIPFIKLGICANSAQLIVDMNLSSMDILEDESIDVTITFNKIDLYAVSNNNGTGKYIIRLITSSTKNFTTTNVFHTGHMLPSTNKTIKLGLETTVKGIKKGTVAPKLFHEPNKQTNNVLYYGCIVELEDKNQGVTVYDGVYYNLYGHINIVRNAKGGSALARTDSRYEYKTLEEISNLQGNAIDKVIPKDYKGAFIGKAPKLKFGKIIIMYSILFPKIPTNFADYNLPGKGILSSSFNVADQPSIFLEEQAGTSKFTNRIEAIKRKSKDLELEEYDLECTEDQFKHWKVVVYFHSTLAEAEFKKQCERYGASLWFVNSTDVPN